MEEQKKISLPEIILMIMIVGGADLFDAITTLVALVPIIGKVFVFTNIFVGIFVLLIIQFWLILKGGIGFKKQLVVLVGNLIELIPGLNILPIRTLTLLIAIYLINHPKIMKIASRTQKTIKTKE